MARLRPFLALAGALALAFGGNAAFAQAAPERTVDYVVRPGDTLIGLSAKYMTTKDAWQTVQQMNRIRDPYHVPIGSRLVIPLRLLRIEPAFGQISSFRGAVSIDGQQATQGMQIHQGMRIETSANAFVTVLFPDGSAISLPSQSIVKVDRLRRIALTDSVDRAFRLQEGRARSTVTPIRNPNSNFQVTTPLSVSAVRGTDFRVGYDPDAKQTQTEVVGGTVGVAPDEDKDETAVPRGYGVIGTPAGIQPPIKLLPPPELTSLARGDGNSVVVTANPVNGAKKYRTQLATDIAFREVIAETVTDKPVATFPGVGSVPFFVRMTAIAESGLEGLPGTFSSGRGNAAPKPGNDSSAPSAENSTPASPAAGAQISMTGDGRSNSAPSVPTRLYAEWLAVALVATLLVTGLVLGRLTERLDFIVYDHALSNAERPPPDDIVIVAIDNRSLQAIGRWPWPRRIHAAALDRLADAHARAVGYDVLFVEPSADDAELARAVRRVPTYLPLVIDVPGSNGAAYDIAMPSGALTPAAAGIAQVNLHFDGDRVIRQAYLEEGGDGRSWLQLGAIMAGLKAEANAVSGRLGLWQERPVLIPYGGAAGHVRTIAFTDLLQGLVPPEIFAGRYVLIGATADGMGDSYPTPTSGTTSQMAGVEIQAHLLDALLRGDVITPASPPWTLAAALAVLWILLIGFLRLSPRGNANLAVGLAVAVFVLTFVLFRFAHFWLPPAAALIGMLFVYPLWGWRRLQAISSYMTGELRQLQGEEDAFPRQARRMSNREVTLQATLLGQAIDRLRDLRRFLSDAIGRLPDALFVTDLHGELALTNAEGRRLAQRLSAPYDRGSDIQQLLAHFRAADDAFFSPFAPGAPDLGGAEAVTEDGGSFEIRYVAQRDAANAQVGWIIRIVDISPLKQAERHREEALQLLSHDMRAPQSAILALLRGPDTRVPKAVKARIEGLAKRTLDLAEDFVQLARAEAKPLAIEPVDLNDIAIDAADSLWPTARARSIKVEVEGIDDPHMIDGDRQLLTRAMVNLIGNAIKYSDEGMRIVCTLDEHDGRIRLAIADQGAGIAEEQLSKLFAKFQQGPREGIGLGLAFVRTVVARHGGTIDCRSAPGKGTTFTIELAKSDVDPYAD